MESNVKTIRKGYKQTEIGVIPVDWDVQPISRIAKITTGSKNTQDKVDTGLYPFFVRSQVIERINSYSYDGEAILTAGDGVGTGKVFHYINGKFDIHQRVYKISDFSNDINGYYFYLYFSNNFYNRIMQMTAKSSVDSVRMEMIADMQIPLPVKTEQALIAKALSDADNLIEKIEALIEKKKNIKQGAMQELLTGKRRMPGFSGVWTRLPLNKMITIPVSDGPHLTPRFIKNGIPFLSVNNLVNNKIDISNPRFISREDHEEFYKKCRPKRNDILLGKAASVGMAAVVDFDIEFNIWSPIALIRLNDKYIPKFICYLFQTDEIKKQIKLLTNSSSQGNLGMGDIGKIEFFSPPKLEQTAIAVILSGMDTEIERLESELTKYRNIKQGMMQTLLTGKIRLIK